MIPIRSSLRRALSTFRKDVEAVREYDPAARDVVDVLIAYPGLHALWMHRVAAALWTRDLSASARLLSTVNRFFTGVEIHPGARLGPGVFIDHGMGVVIGETARVGEGCILYKGVVLGGTSNARGVRHPQLGDGVVVGTNACILGNIEVGDGARIGSGSVVVRGVPAGSTVVGVPGRVVRSGKDSRSKFDAVLDHASLPDPVTEMVRSLRHQNERLRERIVRLERTLHIDASSDEEDPHLLDAELATKDLPSQTGG